VSDLYERLKERIDESDSLSPFHGATRAVLELHKPGPHKFVPAVAWCRRCDCPADQCAEVRAIARALDVPIGDQQ